MSQVGAEPRQGGGGGGRARGREGQRAEGQVEQKSREAGLAWPFLRPTFFMQSLLGLGEMVKGGTIFQPAGTSKASVGDTRDSAAGAVSALTEGGHEGKACDITGPE